MSEPRMSPAALGLRAMPSTAALTALPWPSAPNAAANASAKPAVMIDHCATTAAVPAAAAPVSCANAGDRTPAASTNAIVRNVFFTCRAPVRPVDAVRASMTPNAGNREPRGRRPVAAAVTPAGWCRPGVVRRVPQFQLTEPRPLRGCVRARLVLVRLVIVVGVDRRREVDDRQHHEDERL